jgi:hypothetical protein
MINNLKRVSALHILLTLDAFVLGGCVSLLIVNCLLDNRLSVYGTPSRAANTMLGFMDDLLPYCVVYAVLLMVLILITVGVWIWRAVGDRSTVLNQTDSDSGANTGDKVWPPVITNSLSE